MKKIVLLLGVLGIGFSCVMATGTRKDERRIKELQQLVVQAEIDLNQAEIATYLMYVNQIKYSFPVYSLGGDWVDEYNRTNAEAAAAREYFLKVDDELRAVLMKDSVYRNDPQRGQEVFTRLARTSSDYRDAREKRYMALVQSNIILLRVIAEDYRQKGLILNVPFIDDRTRETLRVMNPMIDILETNKRELKRAYTDAFRRMLNDKYVR